MSRVGCDLPAVFTRQVVFEYVETSFFFAQVVESGAVRCPYRVTVFPAESCNLFEGTILSERAQPDVACDRRLVVLAPGIFISFFVLIKQFVALFIQRQAFHGER